MSSTLHFEPASFRCYPQIVNIRPTAGLLDLLAVYSGKPPLQEDETVESRFIQIQAAYELLVDPDQRRQYDVDNRTNPNKVPLLRLTKSPWFHSVCLAPISCPFQRQQLKPSPEVRLVLSVSAGQGTTTTHPGSASDRIRDDTLAGRLIWCSCRHPRLGGTGLRGRKRLLSNEGRWRFLPGQNSSRGR